jgi:hypothetical protein
MYEKIIHVKFIFLKLEIYKYYYFYEKLSIFYFYFYFKHGLSNFVRLFCYMFIINGDNNNDINDIFNFLIFSIF